MADISGNKFLEAWIGYHRGLSIAILLERKGGVYGEKQ
jgi:hypothetical protein